MTCVTESVRISIPRIPAIRPEPPHGHRFERWREWFYNVRFWSRIRIEDGKAERRPQPLVEGPCRAVATIRWHDGCRGQYRPEVYRLGILEALRRSGIAPELTEVVVARVGCADNEMGTDIEILSMGVQ
jgi:hypothetical protein